MAGPAGGCHPEGMTTVLALSRLTGDVLRSLRDHLRPLIACHLFFTLLASGLLLPAAGWALAHLLARLERPLVSHAAVLEALLTPIGLGWLLALLALAFLVLYLQQAGLTLVAVRPRDHHLKLAVDALWTCLRRLPSLSGLALLQVGSQLALLLPVALAVLVLHDRLLGDLDPDYLRQVRPPALWHFLATAAPAVLGWALAAAALYTRWHLALPVLILEGATPRRALARSARLTRGRGHGIAAAILVLLAAILALPLAATALFDAAFTPLLARLPERPALLMPAMLGYVSAYTLVALAATFVGIAANALMGACLYLRLAHREPRPPTPPPGAHPGRLAWGVELGVIAIAVTQAWLMLQAGEIRERVDIVAHRGSSRAAPENSLAAIERAVREGADLVEVDARLTADEAVVLHHDRSLARLAGDARRIAALDRAALTALSLTGPRGGASRVAGLDEALIRVRGRAGLMIELKGEPGREARLVARVGEALAAEARARRRCRDRAADGVRRAACGDPRVMRRVALASLSYPTLRMIGERLPAARRILLAQLTLRGALPRSGFDILALRHNRVDAAAVRRADRHGYALYAWTVNDPARMSRLIDLGVNGIITDRPGRLRTLLAERQRLGDGALMLVKLHNWLRQ